MVRTIDMNRSIAVLIVTLLTSLAVHAYEPARFEDPGRAERVRALLPEVERTYREFAISNHIPGLAFGVMLDGELILSGAYGFSQLDGKVPARQQSLFRIASMSKSFTAMAILHLRDRGKLRLDDPAEKHLPELKRLTSLTKDSPKITIRDLLTHSAGFPEDNPWGDWQLEDKDSDLVDLVRGGLSLSNPPGLAYEYSNLGYALLGRVVTKLSGISCQRYIDRHILAPLGMQNTQWEYTKVPPALLAHGYRWEEEQWKQEKLLHDGVFGPMGGMISSIEDFAKYMALHLNAWPPRDSADPGPLRRSSIREMHQPGRISGLVSDARKSDGNSCPTVTGYAFGLGWTRDCDGRVALAHSGGLPGFGSNWRILPDYGIGIVTLANRTYAPGSAINTTILNLILDKAKLQPRQLPASSILQKRKNELLKFLPDWNSATNSPIFAENFFGDQSVELRRQATQDLFHKAGEIQRIGELKPQNNLRGTFIIEGSSAKLEIFFTLSPENPPLIQEFKTKELPR
jgi:CubicO group peptidase (beta-lactamase class C family)